MSLVRRKIEDSVWILVTNPLIRVGKCDNPASCYDPYKLHISMHQEVVLDAKVAEKLHALLDKALLDQTITGYKFVDPDARQKHSFRNAHLPYVIYLHPEASEKNLAELLLLCKAIEELLTGVRPACAGFLLNCDLPLSTNLTFRQCSREGKREYINPGARGQEEFDDILKEQGENSIYYRFLSAGMKPKSKLMRAIGAVFSGAAKIFNKVFDCPRLLEDAANDDVLDVDVLEQAPQLSQITLSSNASAMRIVGGAKLATHSVDDPIAESKVSITQRNSADYEPVVVQLAVRKSI